MALTSAQKQTLKAALLADPAVSQTFIDGNLQGTADYLNAAADPVFWIWKNLVTQDEIMQNGFDWVRVDNLSVGKARIWEWLFQNQARSINPSKANVRAGIQECWKGTAPDLAVQAAVLAHCKRGATRLEQIFATGTGSEADPAVGTVYGALSYTELIGL
jgi:hypothetical protein